MIPTIGGAENITWAHEQRAKRREAIEETLMAMLWIAVLCAMLAASFWFGYANGADSKPVIERNTTSIHALPDPFRATAVLGHLEEE